MFRPATFIIFAILTSALPLVPKECAAANIDPGQAVVTIEMEVPVLGRSVSGPAQPFPGGEFSVEKLTYLKGEDVGIGPGDPGEQAFMYGNKYLNVTAGDKHVLVIVCKAEFTEGIPALFKKREVWDSRLQLAVTDEKGASLPGSALNSADDAGPSRYYVVGNVSNEEFSGKIKIYFFSDRLEKQALEGRKTNIDAKKAVETAKEYVAAKGINLADYKTSTVIFKEADNVWEVSFSGEKNTRSAYLVTINGETGEVLGLLEYEVFEGGKRLKRSIQ